MTADSAVPEDLYRYADATTGASADLQRWVRTVLAPAIERYRLGAVTHGRDIPGVTLPDGGRTISDDVLIQLAAVHEVDAEVRRTGRAFEEAGESGGLGWQRGEVAPCLRAPAFEVLAPERRTPAPWFDLWPLLPAVGVPEVVAYAMKIARRYQAGVTAASEFVRGLARFHFSQIQGRVGEGIARRLLEELGQTAFDLNDIHASFPLLDLITDRGFFQVKFGTAETVVKYVKALQQAEAAYLANGTVDATLRKASLYIYQNAQRLLDSGAVPPALAERLRSFFTEDELRAEITRALGTISSSRMEAELRILRDPYLRLIAREIVTGETTFMVPADIAREIRLAGDAAVLKRIQSLRIDYGSVQRFVRWIQFDLARLPNTEQADLVARRGLRWLTSGVDSPGLRRALAAGADLVEGGSAGPSLLSRALSPVLRAAARIADTPAGRLAARLLDSPAGRFTTRIGLPVLGMVGDAAILINPAQNALGGPWMERGAAFLSLVATANVMLDWIPGVGEVVMGATAVYFIGDLVWQNRQWIGDTASHLVHTAADVGGRAFATFEQGGVTLSRDLGQVEAQVSSTVSQTVGTTVDVAKQAFGSFTKDVGQGLSSLIHWP